MRPPNPAMKWAGFARGLSPDTLGRSKPMTTTLDAAAGGGAPPHGTRSASQAIEREGLADQLAANVNSSVLAAHSMIWQARGS
jgi:hypothetical protein